ncbi:hypothetical protein AB9P05_16485 [Roseivirga sp. BDSF3-8]|uniref:hypothetical protein n=1 Tax=Roseivirga sp. BDSF3-8 TaxID=3241598 RepID=UPI0035321D19
MSGPGDKVKENKQNQPERSAHARRRPANGRMMGLQSSSLSSQVNNLTLGDRIGGLFDRIEESPLFTDYSEISQAEQDHLKSEFAVYLDAKRKLITDPDQREDFDKKVEKFLKRMNGRKDDQWGSKRYFRLLEKWFPDYQEVLTGKVNAIKGSITQQIGALNSQLTEVLTKTKEAMQLAGTDAEKARTLLSETSDKLNDARERSDAAAETLKEYGSEEQQAAFQASYSQLIANYGALISSVEGSITGMEADVSRYQGLIPQLDAQVSKLNNFKTSVQAENDVQALIKIQQTEFGAIISEVQSFIQSIDLARGTGAVDGEQLAGETEKGGNALAELDQQVDTIKTEEIARREEEARRKAEEARRRAEEERRRREAEAEAARREQQAAGLEPSGNKEGGLEAKAKNSAAGNVALLISMWNTHGDGDKRKLAYILATVEGECNFRSKSEKRQISARTAGQRELIRLQNRYWDSGFYGRGFVQLTWENNYKKASDFTGEDLVATPDKALVPEIAATVTIRGMVTGMFTGKKLNDYFNDNKTDWVNARRIINGTDKADEFANKAKAHYTRLQSADGGASYYDTLLNFADKQTVLKAEGLYDGRIDGQTGPKSRKAIADFKARYNLSGEAAFDNKIRELLHGPQQEAAAKAEEAAETPDYKQKVEALYTRYDGGKIDMVELGKALIPYASNGGAPHIQTILEKLGSNSEDNLAYAMVSNSDNATLGQYNKALLDDLADALSPENNYFSLEAKEKQYNRITAITDAGSEQQTVAPEASKSGAAVTKLSESKISASVGKGGTNKAKDVQLIQSFLVTFGYLAAGSGEITTVNGLVASNAVVKDDQLTETIEAIKSYQKYGATTTYSSGNQKSVAQGDGLVSKGGITDVSVQSMTKVHNNYSGEEPLHEEVTLLTDSQWVSQFRYGYNFYSGDTEKEYIDYVTELTGYDDANELHKASSEIIQQVYDKYDGKAKWFDMDDSKEQALFTKDKDYDTKGNMVCCFDAAKKMLGFTGATPQGKETKIQTFVEESGKDGNFTKQATLGIQYIDGQLRKGKGVFVAVDKGKEGPVQRNEGTSDHFIIIVGKAKDSKGWYYKYFDPGSSFKERTGISKSNKLHIGDNEVKSSTYNLSQIRINNE